MLQTFKNGQSSIVLRVKLLNSSVSTGAGLTGLTSASSGLIIGTIADNEAAGTAYTVAGSTIETITTLGTYAAPTATKCRFKEVDATNHPGIYEIQLADARYAVSSAKSLLISVSGATNLAQADCVVQLQSDDPYVAKTTPLTAAQIATGVWQDTTAGDFTTAASIGKSVLNGVALGTGLTINGYVGNTVQTGDAYARLGAPANGSVSADVAAVKVDTAAVKVQTDKLTFTVANVLDANALRVGGTVQSAWDLGATRAEPAQGAPGATISYAAKIDYLYKAWRNKATQTSTTFSLFNDGGTVVDHKGTVSDDGTTFTKPQVATGP